jgi:hypothetical protein
MSSSTSRRLRDKKNFLSRNQQSFLSSVFFYKFPLKKIRKPFLDYQLGFLLSPDSERKKSEPRTKRADTLEERATPETAS